MRSLHLALTAVLLLSGCGGSPKASLSASKLDFGGQYVNDTSAEQTINLSNQGSATLRIESIRATAGFQQTNTCGASLKVGAQCTVSVTFTPTTPESYTGSLAFI